MQRYFSNKKEKDIIYINEEDIHHIKNVMRKKENDEIEIVYNEKLYIALLNKDYKTARVKEKKKQEDNTLNVSLLVPILNEDKMSFIIEKSTELGVKEITPINLTRNKFKINKEKEKKKYLRWQKIAKEASEQSKRLTIPKINEIINIEDIIPKNVNILCSTDNKNVKKLNQVLNNIKDNDIIQVVFGPEGGFTSKEEEYLENIGFIKTTFGRRILRTETVPLFILSILNYKELEVKK